MIAAVAALCCALLPQEGKQDKRHLTSAPERLVDLDFQHYYKTAELRRALSNLATAYRDLVQVVSLGKSRNNEDLWLLTLSETRGVDPRLKPAFFVAASQALGDLQGSELTLSSVVDFLQDYARDERVRRALHETTMYFVLCANPDLRNSVLAEIESGSGPAALLDPGIDLDRNYPVGWNPFQAGDERRPRNPGPYPLSEPETQWISSFLVQHENIGVVVGFAPTNWTRAVSATDSAFVREPASLEQLLKAQTLTSGVPVEFAGRAGDPSGTLDDFAYGQLGALPLHLLCGELDESSGLAFPRTEEIAPLARKVRLSLLSISEALPRLSIVPSVQRLKSDLWQIEITLTNAGTLRTQSALGSSRRAVALPKLSVRGGKLAAACVRTGKDQNYLPMTVDDATFSLVELEGGAQLRVRVLVAAAAETTIEMTASAARAGSASASLVLR